MRRFPIVAATLVFTLVSLALFLASTGVGTEISEKDGSRAETGNWMIRPLSALGISLGIRIYLAIEVIFGWLGLNTGYEFLLKWPIKVGLLTFPFLAGAVTWATLTLVALGIRHPRRIKRSTDHS